MTTTAPDSGTLTALSDLVDLPDQGTVFTGLIHKMGVERGSHGTKTIYGDDIKQVLIWTGFSHTALIARSMKILNFQLGKGGYIERMAQVTLDEHGDTTIADVCHALQEVRDWFRRKLAGLPDPDCDMPPGTPPTGSVWQPLKINGITVRGCSIYAGAARPEDPRAPVPGTIYVRGLKLGERMEIGRAHV